MQRTQIYFEPETLQEIKAVAKKLNISASEFIRQVVKKELKVKKENNLKTFLSQMKPIESFNNIDATNYVNEFRSKSRLIDE